MSLKYSGSQHAVADRRKMGESQRGVEEGGFEGGGEWAFPLIIFVQITTDDSKALTDSTYSFDL